MKLPDTVRDVLFVCYGNLCRSVLAEALMKRGLAAEGCRRIVVGSAGIGALPDYPPPREITEIAEKHGLDVSEHRARSLDGPLFDRADLVLVMEPYMKEAIGRVRSGSDLDKVLLLADFAPGAERSEEIQDPYGGPETGFAKCYSEIEACIHGLIETLRSNGSLG